MWAIKQSTEQLFLADVVRIGQCERYGLAGREVTEGLLSDTKKSLRDLDSPLGKMFTGFSLTAH